MDNTLQRNLEDLRYEVSLLTVAIEKASHVTYGGDVAESIRAIDICIDRWNGVINKAPGVLKKVKLHLCDLLDEAWSKQMKTR